MTTAPDQPAEATAPGPDDPTLRQQLAELLNRHPDLDDGVFVVEDRDRWAAWVAYADELADPPESGAARWTVSMSTQPEGTSLVIRTPGGRLARLLHPYATDGDGATAPAHDDAVRKFAEAIVRADRTLAGDIARTLRDEGEPTGELDAAIDAYDRERDLIEQSANRFLIAVQFRDGGPVYGPSGLVPVTFPMTDRDALNFAAWLAALADPLGDTFDAILARVRAS